MILIDYYKNHFDYLNLHMIFIILLYCHVEAMDYQGIVLYVS